MLKSNEIKILELNKNEPEVDLLLDLSHEISNFKSNFRSGLKHTFILSPWASSLFGLEISRGKAYIGVPEMIFKNLSRTRIYLANYIKGKPGLYIVIDMGGHENKRPVAIRIHVREKRIEALSKFKEIYLIKMNESGVAKPGYDEDQVKLLLREVKSLDWENFVKK